MGRPKALLRWREGTFLSSAIRAIAPESDLVIVVAGDNANELHPTVDSMGAFLVNNPDPARGQFSSMQVGLQEVLNRGRDSAILTLVDRPAPQVPTVRDLKQQFLRKITEGFWAVVPSYQGQHGHPALFSREMITEFLNASSTANAREILHRNQQRIAYVEVEDPLVIANIDTPEDYERLIGANASSTAR